MDLRIAVTLGLGLLMGVSCSTDGIHAGPTPDPKIPDAFKVLSVEPAWSPEGSRIAFTYYARRPEELALGASQLWLYSLDAKKVTYLTEGHSANWSPSSDRIVYAIGSILWILDLESKEKTQLTDFDLAFQPRWSPTGEHILFMRWTPSQGLWTIQPDGSNLQEVGVPSFSADWSQDGTLIACNSASSHELLTVPLGFGAPSLLIDNAPSICKYPRWSPAGTWIAYFRYGGEVGFGIWLIRPDGTDAHKLLSGGRSSSWSPDGTELVYEYSSELSGDYALWVYSSVTSTSKPLFGD